MALLRNASFNLLGGVAPAVLNVITLPYIVSTLGVADFGLLVLITSIVGYFALLDINVTAGSTKYVAQFLAAGDEHRVNQTICFGLLIYAAIGVAGCLGLFVFAGSLVDTFFTIPPDRRAGALAALHVAAVGFAVGQLHAYLNSLPGAMMRFDVTGKLEATFGCLLPLLSVLLLHFGHGLVALVWLRLVMSLLQASLLGYVMWKLIPSFRWELPGAELRRALFSFSSYAFLNRLAALSYEQADKLIISARLGVSSLTFYVVPTTLANRIMSLTFRLSSVMFPHTSALAAQSRLRELEYDYLAASRYVFFINGAIAVTIAALAHPLLTHWMGPEFADTGAIIMTMITVGQWFDSMTNLPSLVNDGLGHPKVTGLFALSRALLGLGLTLAGVAAFGIKGAAGAHLIASMVMATIFIAFVHGRSVPIALGTLISRAYRVPTAVLICIAGAGWLLVPWAGRGVVELVVAIGIMALISAASGFWLVLLPPHRQACLAQMRLRPHARR